MGTQCMSVECNALWDMTLLSLPASYTLWLLLVCIAIRNVSDLVLD